MCEKLLLDAVQILDYYHMAENVYNYANMLYPYDDKKRTRWAETIIWYIKSDQYKKAVQTAKKAPLCEESTEKTVNLLGSLENNKNRLNYLQYESEDLYIGSDIIEGGNKVVFQKRMKQCGMRWNVNGGQYIAALRTKAHRKMRKPPLGGFQRLPQFFELTVITDTVYRFHHYVFLRLYWYQLD